jgi:hypothetical protein
MALLRAKPFRFTPPPGFDEFPAAKEMVAHALLAFIKGDPTDDRPDIILVIEDLGGTIGKMDFSPFVQGRENVRLLSEPWGTHRVPVLELREAFGDAETLTYNAQVPLLPTAVQVKVVGVAELGSQLLETLREALKRLEGPTNW